MKSMEGVSILTNDKIPVLAKELMGELRNILREEKKEKEPYLIPSQLMNYFPYSKEWFRDKINAGEFGKKARNGDTMATYKEVHTYLFGK